MPSLLGNDSESSLHDMPALGLLTADTPRSPKSRKPSLQGTNLDMSLDDDETLAHKRQRCNSKGQPLPGESESGQPAVHGNITTALSTARRLSEADLPNTQMPIEASEGGPPERERNLYDAFVLHTDVNMSALVTVDEMKIVFKGLGITQEDAFLIFRLAQAGKANPVPMQDVMIRVLSGLGHKHDEMRLKFGLSPVWIRSKQRRPSTNADADKGGPLNFALGGGNAERRIQNRVRKLGQYRAKASGGNQASTGMGGFTLGVGNEVPEPKSEPGGRLAAKPRAQMLNKSKALQMGIGKQALSKAFRSVPRALQGQRAQPEDLSKSNLSGGSATSKFADADQTEMRESILPDTMVSANELESGAEAGSSDNFDTGPKIRAKPHRRKRCSSSPSSDIEGSTSPSGSSATDGDDTDGFDALGPLRSSSMHGDQACSSPSAIASSSAGDERSAVDSSLSMTSSVSMSSSGRPKNSESRTQKNFTKLQSDKRKVATSDSIAALALDMFSTEGHSQAKEVFTAQACAAKLKKHASPKRAAIKDTLPQGDSLGFLVGKDASGSPTDAWAFKDDADHQQRRSLSGDNEQELAAAFEGPERDLEAEAIKLKVHERNEITKHQWRLSLFLEDAVELEFATHKLQECRSRILGLQQFKTIAKAFDSFAGGRDAVITLKAFKNQLVKILKYNSLDAERIVAVMATAEDSDQVLKQDSPIGFAQCLHIFRFAKPVPTLLDLRARFVERYGTLDAAFNVLNFRRNMDFSIDMFEKPMLGAGILSADSIRLFKVMDHAQLDGPAGFLRIETIRFFIDQAHILGWLACLNSRLGGRSGVRAAFEKLPGDANAVLATAVDLEISVVRLGFPHVFVSAIFNFMHQRNLGKVTLGSLKQLMHNLEDATRDRRERAGTDGVAGTGESISAGPSEAEKDRGLALTTELRQRVMREFSNYSEAYEAFAAKRPDEGVTLEEWESAQSAFGFTDAHAWALIFGQIVEWQHVRWDPKYLSMDNRIKLEKLASSLNAAAPCRSLAGLRTRLSEKCPGIPQAWTLLTSKDNAEEITLAQWQKALRNLWIGLADAGHLFAVLKVVPFQPLVGSHDQQILFKSTFLHGLKGDRAIEAYARFMDLMLLLTNRKGAVSASFEGHYPSQPLAVPEFEDTVSSLLRVSRQDVRPLFGWCAAHHKDSTKDGGVLVSALMDTLTEMQADYLPYSRQQHEEELAGRPKGMTGSTTIPNDSATPGGDSSAESGSEMIRPQTSPAGPATRRLSNMSPEPMLLPGEFQGLRPGTAPDEGASPHKHGGQGRPPLALNLRMLVDDRLGKIKDAEGAPAAPPASDSSAPSSAAISRYATKQPFESEASAVSAAPAETPAETPAPAVPQSARTAPPPVGWTRTLTGAPCSLNAQPPGWGQAQAAEPIRRRLSETLADISAGGHHWQAGPAALTSAPAEDPAQKSKVLDFIASHGGGSSGGIEHGASSSSAAPLSARSHNSVVDSARGVRPGGQPLQKNLFAGGALANLLGTKQPVLERGHGQSPAPEGGNASGLSGALRSVQVGFGRASPAETAAADRFTLPGVQLGGLTSAAATFGLRKAKAKPQAAKASAPLASPRPNLQAVAGNLTAASLAVNGLK
jgi:hypothetical protein